ncbi:MAG: hypothetical protein KKG25_10455 [Bacteroidetes bacterium]|nr:hypothetical protein [Bacteroidota bacterium]MBU1485263.1 hypothetical protein [Bacteroidota bacterium]MBU1760176.1 hypothetical protein [Bacteroidota bacterium]MBU2267775.1 hypothetical protein [Bacteroidota bacterium]MBU2374962.1 hypothetical protein [Bacteroidota bacterium]
MSVLFVASVGKAQSLDDAQKAVTAEQYQKAKAMFSELVKVQPTPENYFGFGELYLTLNNPDSAKIVFEKGIKADERSKYMMNYIGLGTVNLFKHNDAAAKENFEKATEDMRKKDYEQYIYIGKAYTYEGSRNLSKAFEWFAKADEYGEKDPMLHIAEGNAYKFQKKNSEAVREYQRAMSLKDNLLAVEVNVGEIWTQAFNFELAESTLKAVIAKDPNFGPAYRALAENYYRWAPVVPNRQAELLGLAKTNYSKYLDLTDRSTESRYRYLIFLFNAKDYATLEKEATTFINSPGYKKDYIVARRFRGYSSIENGNNEVGIDALNNFIANSSVEHPIIADDYLYLGKAYENQKQDSLAILSYVKGYSLDTTNIEVLRTIANNYKNNKKYGKAADFYDKVAGLSKESYQDWFYAGYMRYFAYANMVSANSTDTALMKSTLLKSDSALTYVAEKTKNLAAYLYKARVEYYLDPVNQNVKVKDAYEKVVEIVTEKPEPSAAENKYLVEAYSSIGAFYIASDKLKAKEYFDKALLIDPNNQQVKDALAALKASKS